MGIARWASLPDCPSSSLIDTVLMAFPLRVLASIVVGGMLDRQNTTRPIPVMGNMVAVSDIDIDFEEIKEEYTHHSPCSPCNGDRVILE